MTVEATMHTFDTPQPIRLRAEVWEGSMTIVAEDTDTTTVELIAMGGGDSAAQLIAEARVEQRGDEIVVLLPKIRSGLLRRGLPVQATIHLPRHSSAKLQTASADIVTEGELAEVKANGGSGDIQLDHVVDAEVRTGSGDLSIETVTGSLDVKGGSSDVQVTTIGSGAVIISGSGDVQVGKIEGPMSVKSGSGDVVVTSVGHSIDAMAGSGDVVLKRVDHGRVNAKTGSGDILIGVADGTSAYLDILTVSGEVRSDLDDSSAPSNGELSVEIRAKTGSGDVILQRS